MSAATPPTPADRELRLLAAVLSGIAVLSGCSALVFETLWFRSAGLTFGNGLWASSLVLAAFMTGLATGNGLAARVGPGLARPLRAYVGLELAIAVSGIALVFVLPLLTGVLAPLFAGLRAHPWLFNTLRFPLAFVLLTVPATAMGATLPVLVKALAAREARFAGVLGRLYGWNTLGAVAGALVGEAWWIEAFGIRGTAFAAGALNLAAAAGAAWLARRGLDSGPLRPPVLAGGRRGGRLLAAAFLSGGIFLALEVVWFRFLSLFVYGTSLVFAVMLAVVLVGIAAGGLLAGRRLRAGGGAPALPALALAAGALTLLCYAAFEPVFRVALPPGTAAAALPHVALLGLPLMLPVAVLSGALFTAIGDAAVQVFGEASRTTGYLTLANTLGAAVGSLLGGFVLLPRFGIEDSLFGLALAYAAVAALGWIPAAPPRGRARWTAAAAAAALVALVAAGPRGTLREVYLVHPTLPFAGPGSEIAAVREGLLQTLVLQRTRRFGRPYTYRLFTDGFSMSGTTLASKRYMKAFVYLAAALHPGPRRALLISYGVGSTARALADDASLQAIDVVDISSDILALSPIVFPAPGSNPLDDPRVRVHVEDGRYFLQTSDQRYDLITGEPPPPKYAGVVNLYTEEYFRLVHERLAEGGLFTYWLPVHSLTESDARAILRAFCDAFPDCSLWSGAGMDWILLGSRDARGAVPLERLRHQWEDPRVAPELRALGFESPAQLGATFLAGAEELRRATAADAPLTDDHPLRLSHEPVLPDAAWGVPLFRRWMEPDHARQAFLSSEVGARWPREARDATLQAFAWQGLVNRRLGYGGDEAGALTEADLVRVLTDTQLRALPLWLLGSDAYEQALAAEVRGPAARRRGVQRVLGLGALADRRYAEAAAHFRAAARAGRGRAARLRLLEVLSLCLAGDLDAAEAVARPLVRSTPALARDDARWHWLAESFGLPDPRTPPGVRGSG